MYVGGYDGAVRLFGGKSRNEGQVEFYYRGTWRAVCDSTWDITDGNVVCQQLGFPGAKMVTRNSFFPIGNDGSSMITLTGTHCSGSEPSLALCLGSSWGADGCNRSHYAGVVCKGMYVRTYLHTYIHGHCEVFSQGCFVHMLNLFKLHCFHALRMLCMLQQR